MPGVLYVDPSWHGDRGDHLEGVSSGVAETRRAFAAAGFRQEIVEQVPDIRRGSLADFFGQVDTLRRADTTMRDLTEDEFRRGKERLRRAVEAEDTADPAPRSNWARPPCSALTGPSARRTSMSHGGQKECSAVACPEG
jgi:hypothetical protein